MAGYPGSVPLTGYIAPKDTADTYALQDERFNRGGYRTVADTTERDNITEDRRKEGMLVKVLSTDEFWTLKGGITNSDWELVDFGGSGSETFWTVESDSDITESGYYFLVDGASVRIMNDFVNDRVFRIKAVDNESKVTVETGIIDDIEQEIVLNKTQAIVILAKSNQEYYILCNY